MLRFYGGLLSAGSIVRHSLAGYTRRVRPWLQYTLARLGLFVAIFVILLVFGVEGWLSAQIDAADVAGSEPDGPAEQQRVGE